VKPLLDRRFDKFRFIGEALAMLQAKGRPR